MFRAIARGLLIACPLSAGSAEAAWPERAVTIVTQLRDIMVGLNL